MERLTKQVLAVLIYWLAASVGHAQQNWKHFQGMCDASAMEMLTDDLFVVANDEDNVLRVYSRTNQGLPVQSVNFGSFYRLRRAKQEIDLEGSARIGDRIYWISSHGSNAKGKYQPGRHRFFATTVVTNHGQMQLVPEGQLYARLLQDLAAEPELASLNLRAAAQKPPKSEGALNIEALAATPEGHLLIAFRNPIPDGNALLVPLLNPDGVISGKKAVFGKHLLVDLKGLGIRSMISQKKGYLVIAGAHDSDGVSQLYFWDGQSPNAQLLSTGGLPGNPEAIASFRGGDRENLFVLNDDGSRKVGGQECKKLKDPRARAFRGYELAL